MDHFAIVPMEMRLCLKRKSSLFFLVVDCGFVKIKVFSVETGLGKLCCNIETVVTYQLIYHNILYCLLNKLST